MDFLAPAEAVDPAGDGVGLTFGGGGFNVGSSGASAYEKPVWGFCCGFVAVDRDIGLFVGGMWRVGTRERRASGSGGKGVEPQLSRAAAAVQAACIRVRGVVYNAIPRRVQSTWVEVEVSVNAKCLR